MKRNLLMLGLPIVTGLSLMLASCGNPAAETEEVQQPGAAPTNVEDNDDEDAPGKGINAQDDDGEENDGDND